MNGRIQLDDGHVVGLFIETTGKDKGTWLNCLTCHVEQNFGRDRVDVDKGAVKAWHDSKRVEQGL